MYVNFLHISALNLPITLVHFYNPLFLIQFFSFPSFFFFKGEFQSTRSSGKISYVTLTSLAPSTYRGIGVTCLAFSPLSPSKHLNPPIKKDFPLFESWKMAFTPVWSWLSSIDQSPLSLSLLSHHHTHLLVLDLTCGDLKNSILMRSIKRNW